MRRAAAYCLLGAVFLLLQTALLPRLLPASLKPDLLLVLAVYLGLNEPWLRGGILAGALGHLQDVFAGVYPGLHGLCLLGIFLAVRGAAGRFNTESSFLLLLLVGLGTLLQAAILLFALGFFAEAGTAWQIILGRLLPQAGLNLAAAFLLLRGGIRLQKRLAPRSGIPGLRRLDSRYGS